jgi:hypothetical protein
MVEFGVFIKSTPARHAKVVEIKQMIAQAYRFREKSDLEACAELVADIVLESAKINPAKADRIPRAEERADFLRSMSEPPKNAAADWQKSCFDILSRDLRFISSQLVHFENQLAISLRVEASINREPKFRTTLLKHTKFI